MSDLRTGHSGRGRQRVKSHLGGIVTSSVLNLPRLVMAGFAAGGWVIVSGLVMAGTFGYRDMKTAFDGIGLPIPGGMEPFVVHTLVRLLTGFTLVILYAIMSRALAPGHAWLVAAGVTWLLGAVLPLAVVVEWGLFPWTLAVKLWAWSAGELLLAGVIGKSLYSP
jgi:hypothetical protein